MGAVTLACVADARVHSAGGGAGTSGEIPVGYWTTGLTGVYRGLLRFALPDWSALGIRRVTSAKLRLRNSTQVYVGRGASPQLLVKRCLTSWAEGSSGSLSASNAVNWANQPGTTAAGQSDTGSLSTIDNTWLDIDVTAIVRAWAPVSVEGGGGQPSYGFALHSIGEASTAYTTEFYSRETTSKPVLVVTYESNTAPLAPKFLVPATAEDGNASIASVTRDAVSAYLTFAGRREDPDVGDYITAVRIQVLADSATDAVPGAAVLDAVFSDFTGEPLVFERQIKITGTSLVIGTIYRWRAITRDKTGLWGVWSSLLVGRIRPNTVPGAPANTAADPGSQQPNFYGSLVDGDPGATISEVQIQVFQDSSTGALQKWDSGWVASGGTRFAIAYSGGQVLEYGITYRWRSRVKDNIGSEGAWGAWGYWTPRQVIGADNMTPRSIEAKQNSVTPTLTIAHAAAFDAYEFEVARYSDGSELLWDVPPTTMTLGTSVAIVYAGASLEWGRTYWWRSKIRVAGTTWSEWSPWYPFYINAAPVAPVVTVDGAVVSRAGTVFPVVPYVTVASLTPTIRLPFVDPDVAKGYAEAPTRREIDLRNYGTGVPIAGSPFVITTGITDTFVPPALTLNTLYWVRARYDDAGGARSPWSEPLHFVVSANPTVSAGAAPSSSDPTPTLAWVFTGSGGRTQRRFQVRIFDLGPIDLVDAFERPDSTGSVDALGFAPSGHKWTLTGANALDAGIYSGFYTHAGAAISNSYAYTELGAPPPRVHAMISFAGAGDGTPPYSTGVTLCTYATTPALFTYDRELVHLVFLRAEYQLMLFDAGAQELIATGAYPALADGIAYPVGMRVSGNTVTIEKPDGTEASVTDARVSRLHGRNFFIQCLRGGVALARFNSVGAVFDAVDNLVHDSGPLESATAAYVVPAGILQHSRDYRWEVVAYDTDLLSATLA